MNKSKTPALVELTLEEGRQDVIKSQMVIDEMEKNEADEGRGSLREVKEGNLDRMAGEATSEQRCGGPERSPVGSGRNGFQEAERRARRGRRGEAGGQRESVAAVVALFLQVKWEAWRL